jgi:hypothetical protein
MAVVASRNRLIYFRVSEEELERFRSLAESKGSRSLSDLAREAIEQLHRGEAEPPYPALLERIDGLQSTLDSVSVRLEELSGKLRARTAGDGTFLEGERV